VASPPSQLPSGRRRFFPSTWPGRAALAGGIWAVAMVVLVVVRSGESSSSTPSNRPVKAAVAADMVSSDSCRSCHPGNYASWHASFHRTMTQVAEPANFATKMDGLELAHNGLDYRVERAGNAYRVFTKRAGTPASDYAEPRQIVLLTGSHTVQVYWLETGDGRTVGQFPFAYLIGEKRWAPLKDTFLTPPDPGDLYGKGEWNNTCMNCHVTQPVARPIAGGNSGTFDSKVGEFGIACEACHSGGREHIELNRSPFRRFALHLAGRSDPTIVNPARLSGPESSLVCGQCHSIWAFKTEADAMVYVHDGAQYRPGQKEIDRRWIAQPKGTDHPDERAALDRNDPHFFDDTFWPDGQIRVIGREFNSVSASPCFTGGKYSCLSCHELHPAKTDPASLAAWASSGQLKPGMETNQACLQCHTKFAQVATLTAHTHHAADSAGSSCYNCHMPRTIYGLLKATRSHQIASPSAHETADMGRLNACNLCHLDQPLAWTAAKLQEWYGQRPPPALDADDRELATGAKWILQGDARQRSLIVLSMGWEPVQKAAGREWFYPYLIFELNDPYSAVRYGAWKSLRTLPGFTDYKFDYTADDAQQKEAVATQYRKWWFETRQANGGYRAQTILEPSGIFHQETFDHRDNKKITVVE